MKYFYSHLIKIESIIIELDKMDLTDEQKSHLASYVDSSLHHAILDAILSELTDQDKRIFIQHLNKGDHNKIWRFLTEKVDGVEDKIEKASEDLKEELHKDVKNAKRIKNKE